MNSFFEILNCMWFIRLHAFIEISSISACRQVITRKSSLQKIVGHLIEHFGTAQFFELKIINACLGVEKLMTNEIVYISELKPQLNAGDDYRARELTIEHQFVRKFDFRNLKNILVHVI